MFREVSAKLNVAMPRTLSIEDKFGGLAEEARRRGDIQTWNLYMTACVLASQADGVLIAAMSPDGELFLPPSNNRKPSAN